MANLILICGYPKSGTTLLLSLLDGHTQLNVFPEETKWFTEVHHLFSRQKRNRHILRSSGLANIAYGKFNYEVSGSRDYSDIDAVGFEQDITEVISDPSKSKSKLFAEIYHIWHVYSRQAKNPAKYLVEKTPGNEFFRHQILNDFPDAKFLFCIRDPRDNFCSYKIKRPEIDIYTFLKRWLDSFNIIQLLPPQNVHLIRYEDLLKDSEKTLSSIAEFLDIEKQASLFEPTRHGKVWDGNSMHKENSVGKINDFALKQRWKDQLSDQEIQTIETNLAGPMQDLGYELSRKLDPTRNITSLSLFSPIRIFFAGLKRKIRMNLLTP